MTHSWTTDRLGDLTGRRIIVTGSTNGVGLATARALTAAGAHVILAVRDTDLGARRAAEMGGSTTVAELDLASLSSVRAFAAGIDADVDILINNAGAVIRDRSETVDGFEKTIGTNFLGPFALTNLLFPRVRSQIINVGSDVHKSASLRLDDLHKRTTKWTMMGAYGQSKLAVMLWGLELDRRLRTGAAVVTHLTHPGWVASNLSNLSEAPVMTMLHRATQKFANTFANDLDAGAAPTLYCIAEPIPPGSYVGIDGRFGLAGGPTLAGRSAEACDYSIAQRLWLLAEQETGTAWPG